MNVISCAFPPPCRSAAPRSAVCVFQLQDFRAVFSGSYRTFDMETHRWSPQQGNHPNFGKVRVFGLQNRFGTESVCRSLVTTLVDTAISLSVDWTETPTAF